MIVELDNNLSHYADVIKKALHVDVKDVPGAGAAGGMGAALMAFLGAELKSGIEIVTTALNLEEHIHDCTLVITGEGRIDSQSIHGKVPIGVANVAKKYHKPVIGIAGSLTNDVGVVHQHGIDAVFSVLTSIGTLDEAPAELMTISAVLHVISPRHWRLECATRGDKGAQTLYTARRS